MTPAARPTVPPRDGCGRRSAIYHGRLAHRRLRPAEHRFAYGVYHLLVDLDELAELDAVVTCFGHNRAAPVSIHDVDHLGTADRPIRDKLAEWIGGRGRALPGGPVLLVCNPRVLGYVFNPVSWFFCYTPTGELELVVAEVCNTFGESYAYLLDELAVTGPTVRAGTAKRFHVSPFMDIPDHGYRFAFRPPGERLVVHMDVRDGDGQLFAATLSEQRRSLTTSALWWAQARYPLMTLRTIGAIHWQALKLWAKRVPVFSKPEPPDAGFPDGRTARTARQDRPPRRIPAAGGHAPSPEEPR